MKHTIKSILSLVAALVLTLTMLTGCSSDNVQKTIATASSSTDAPTSTINVPNAPEITATPAPSAVPTETPVPGPFAGLSETQKNSVAMLNYLGTLMQQVHASKGSRLYLESVYDEIINNINPTAVDETTHEHFIEIFSQLKRFMMVAIKRERLVYIYEQNKAQAIRQAIPNPVGLLSAASSMNLASLVTSVVYMAIDAKTSYDAANAQNELQYLQNSWELDDEELDVILASREDAFSYLLDIVNEYKLPKGITLNSDAVQSFVNHKNSDNVTARVQYLEDHKDTYQAYGGYWLTLAQSYYSLAEQGHPEMYEDCLDAIDQYQNLQINIFRKDVDFANVLPLAIIACEHVYEGNEYEANVLNFNQIMLENCAADEWAIPYFGAQTYVMLAGKTGKREYLDMAYKIARSNVTLLYPTQIEQNAEYLTPVAQLHMSDPKGATEAQKADVRNYNTILDNRRKTELPPVYEPLQLNCALLFSLANEIGIDSKEKAWIDSILHKDGTALFLIEPLDRAYYFAPEKAFSALDIDVNFNDGKNLSMSVAGICSDSMITVSVTSGDETTVFDDWSLTQVVRKQEGLLSTFIASYKSSAINSFSYHNGDEITIQVEIIKGAEVEPYQIKYKVVDNGVKVPVVNLDASWIPHGLTFERVTE